MVTDYLAVSYTNGKPFGVFAVAKAPGSLLNEAMYTTKSALLSSPNEPVFSSRGENLLPGVKKLREEVLRPGRQESNSDVADPASERKSASRSRVDSAG